MQEVFENIIEMLEEEKNDLTDWAEDIAFGLGIRRSIEIVKQAAAEYKHGHFGCNTNGQHEKCSSCYDYGCKNRNRTWFGVEDDNNGWIPCSGCIDCKHKECDHHGKV